jgi:hypothetical protein
MAKLELTTNKAAGNREFLVPIFEVPNEYNRDYGYAYDHRGEMFTPTQVLPCPYHAHPSEPDICALCPGYVQAPWMNHPRCWGLNRKLWLKEVT